MSRPLRIKYPDAWYHILNRGRRSENIFSDEEDSYFIYGVVGRNFGNVEHPDCLHKNHFFSLLSKNRKDWLRNYKKWMSVEEENEASSVIERMKKKLAGDRKFALRLDQLTESIIKS